MATLETGRNAVLLIHGGVDVDVWCRRDDGTIPNKARAALLQALREGRDVLQRKGSALDACAAAIRVMEDEPYFDAGHGSVFTHDGTNTMDAAVMEGDSLRAGAVANVRHVRNPIDLALAVMRHSGHAMIAGTGAEQFAREQGLTMEPADYFHTDVRYEQWQKALADEAEQRASTPKHGTVGAVAIDDDGRMAAATSTGGTTNKRWGRIGDSPVIGAGTYANDACAVSCTGWGEYFIRAAAAHTICLRVAEMHQRVADAADDVINRLIPQLGGDGGAIALARSGDFAMPFNTVGMYRGYVDAHGDIHAAIWNDDTLTGTHTVTAGSAATQ